MKYMAIILLNSITIFGAAHNNEEYIQYIHSIKNKRRFVKISRQLSDSHEVYKRETFSQGPSVIEEAILDRETGQCTKKILATETMDFSLFKELKQQYYDHFTKQTDAHKLAFLALTMAPTPFITQEKENLRTLSLVAQEQVITYYIFNDNGIRTKVARDRCLQRTTDSDDEIISWSLSNHEETAQKIYSLAREAYERQKLAELRIGSQDRHQK